MKNQSIDNPFKFIIRLLSRYNFVIFIVIVAIGLSTCILILNNIMNQPYNTGNSESATSTIFDQTTISQLNTLKPSISNTQYKTMPPDRVNPFSE
jgi:hypothetical protein